MLSAITYVCFGKQHIQQILFRVECNLQPGGQQHTLSSMYNALGAASKQQCPMRAARAISSGGCERTHNMHKDIYILL